MKIDRKKMYRFPWLKTDNPGGWALKNIHKVQHISFIACRSVPADDSLRFYASDRNVETSSLLNLEENPFNISITSEEMFGMVNEKYPGLRPVAYLNGPARYETNKFLVVVNIGSKSKHYGVPGKTDQSMQA
jgi:hypothetical protein